MFPAPYPELVPLVLVLVLEAGIPCLLITNDIQIHGPPATQAAHKKWQAIDPDLPSALRLET